MTILQLGYLEEVLSFVERLIEESSCQNPNYRSSIFIEDTDGKIIKSKIVQIRRGIKQERNILSQTENKEEGGSQE